jgi:hypothetical protein
MGGDLPQNKKLEIDAAEFRICAERRLGEMLVEQKRTVGLSSEGDGLPPEKWSSLMYGLWPDGGLKNGKEATHCGRDRHEAAAG